MSSKYPDNYPASHEAGPRRSSRSRHRELTFRSCLSCHRRKVRCDRSIPCGNCSKGGWSCVYPRKDSDVPRRPATVQDVMDRLGRVETMLSRALHSQHHHQYQHQQETPGSDKTQGLAQYDGSNFGSYPWERLVNDGHRVQYVNNSILRDLLPDNILSSQTCPRAKSNNMFSDLYKAHPSPDVALRLWATFVKNVDPVLKILHIPTTQSAMVTTILDPKSAELPLLALAFAIYFAAITSLDTKHAVAVCQGDPQVLLGQYSSSLYLILFEGGLPDKPDLVSLQALVIFITFLRVHEIGRRIWVLTGLAIRLAQSIGLHRDGQSFHLSPFETELRLRLWWYLCLLDSRAPEDHGLEMTVDILTNEIRLPLNVEDSQLYPNMTKLPEEATHWTEMSFFLVQIQSARLLHSVLGTGVKASEYAPSDLATKRALIENQTQWLKRKYFATSHEESRLCHLAYRHHETACMKMQFLLQLREDVQSSQQENPHVGLGDISQSVSAFKLAYGALKNSHALFVGEISGPFAWLPRIYTQWYALAYVLRCLGTTACPLGMTDHVWALVDEVFCHIDQTQKCPATSSNQSPHSGIWQCLKLLRDQALSLRQNARQDISLGKPVVSENELDHVNDLGMAPWRDESVQHARGDSSLAYSPGDWPVVSHSFLSEQASEAVPFISEWHAVINGNFGHLS